MKQNEAINRAVAIMGNAKRLASQVGVSSTAVSKWQKGGGISVSAAAKIEEITGGEVTMKEISDGIQARQIQGDQK